MKTAADVLPNVGHTGARVSTPRPLPTRLALLAIVLLGTLLRLIHLGDRPLGGNEAFALRVISEPFGDLFSPQLVDNGTQFGFYLIAYFWNALSPESPALLVPFLRLLPLGFAVATIPLVYLVARELVQPLALRALYERLFPPLAALLFALSPVAVQYAGEFRAYSLQLFLLVSATLIALRAVRAERAGRWWVAYGLLAAGAIYAHGLSAIYLAAQGVALLVAIGGKTRRRVASDLVKSGLVVFFLTLPLSLTLLLYGPSPMSWIMPLTIDRVLSTVGRLVGAANASVSPTAGSGPGLLLQDPLLLLVAALPAIIGGALLARRWRTATATVAIVLIPLLAVPLAFTALSLLIARIWVMRYLLVLLPSLLLLTAAGLLALGVWTAQQGRQGRPLLAGLGGLVLLATALIPLAHLLADATQVPS